MRMVRAELKDVYHVHKLYMAYYQDIGKPKDDETVSNQWISNLTNEKKHYILILHGRKALGLVWGEDVGEAFKVEGIFLKRAWRGKPRFSKWIYRALLEKKKNFGKLLICIPEDCKGLNVSKLKPDHRVYSF